ncbi:MFS transporter [Clostridium sp. 19966]|uniref:MFS transporter n=1 Tax=Clostridium sp. 19966 TaxID=2768166 RepID=UPI0028DEC2D5|nr:MFS transporter [Clostridium sp. 19966]MDT8717522.1 MFS transporter [Clostridium sp. 19966]
MLKNNFQKFLSADLISQFGAGMTLSAISWFILDKSGSNSLVAAASNVNIISGLIISIFAGAIIDHFSKKATIVFSLILRAAFVVIPLILLATYGFNKYFLFILALNNGLGWNIYFPASKGLIQSITKKEDLLKMNSGAEITMQIGLFSSGAIAGLLYKYFGFNIILVISSVTFLIGAAIVNSIKIQEAEAEEKINNGFIEIFREGFSYLKAHKFIFVLGIIMYIPFVAGSSFSTILPGFVRQVLKGDSTVYGLVDMFYGVGACVGGIAIIGIAKRISSRLLITVGFAISTSAAIIMFLNKSVLLACMITITFGICSAGIRTVIYSLIMRTVPNAYLGRIMSVWNAISLTLQVIVTYSIGRITDKVSVAYGFLFYAAVMLIGLIMYSISAKLSAEKAINEDDVDKITSKAE